MSVWDEVVGQEATVATLRQAAVDPTAMTHAWLITGPPGSGRSVVARAFAAALECEHRSADGEGPGCGQCRQCVPVMAGSHPDVAVLSTDKVTITIDEVRALVATAARTASSGRYRVMIVEDADRMAERSTNVLLKAVEEPPPHTVWILCAPSPGDVLPTIRSRCRLVTLRIPPAEAVADLLVRRDGVDPALALASARAAQSHVGVARWLARDPEARRRRSQTLDLVARISGVGDAVLAAETLVNVAKAEALASGGERDAPERAQLLRALGLEEGEAVPPRLRAQVKALQDDQKRRATRRQRDVLDRALLDILSLYRDVLTLQLGADRPGGDSAASGGAVFEDAASNSAASRGVALVNGDDPVGGPAARALAARSTPEQTLRRMDAVGVARSRLAGNVAPLLAMEAMAVALA
jgi:DNA polymerase-3 subunit delta'